MDKQTFILWPDKPLIRENAVRAVQGLPGDVAYDVVIKRHVNSKTAEQRGWFHVLCGLFGEQVGLSMGQVKEIVKAEQFGWKRISYGGVELVLADGHSERLNAKDYGLLIDTLYRLAGDSGIVLPEPDKYR